MKLNRVIIVIAAASLIACGNEKEKEEISTVDETNEATLETVDQRLSYIMGNNIAKQFKSDRIELDIQALQLGIADMQDESESRLSQEEIQRTITTLQERAQKYQQALRVEQADKNRAEGEAYLAENATKEGVIVTESGLQYKEIVTGEGSQPSLDDKVTVHYRGTLIDGTEFDSSYSRGEPASFQVQQVIPGWVEALQLMQVGDKWELVVPSGLAYGPGGTGNVIGPDATLLFEVELLGLEEGDANEEEAKTDAGIEAKVEAKPTE